MKNYRLYLIRHGVTDGNLRGAYIGCRSDIPLCDVGIGELGDLAGRFRYPSVEAVYTSPMLRCRQTAAILYPNLPPKVEEDLREIDFGEFENLTLQDVEHRPEFQAWIDSYMMTAPPGGESGTDFTRRIMAGLENVLKDMMAKGITDAAVISHGGVIASLVYAIALPQLEYIRCMVGNGRGFALATSAQLWMRDQKAELLCTLPEGDGDVSAGNPEWLNRLDSANAPSPDEFKGAIQ